MRLLVAGITGQFGAGLLEAEETAPVEYLPLVRSTARRGIEARLRAAYPDHPELAETALVGDVTQPCWSLDEATIRRLALDIDGVLNVAGETNWAARRRELDAVNSIGAIHGYELTRALERAAGARKLYCYVSSIHAAGSAEGRLPEMPFAPSSVRTAYELSKWIGETALLHRAQRDGSDGPALCIARIGGLLGGSKSGETRWRNALYLLADRVEDLPLGLLPLSRGGRVDMLHRDVAARTMLDALATLHASPPDRPEILHVCAGESAPLTRTLLSALESVDLSHRHRRARIVPVPRGAVLAASEQLTRYLEVPRSWRNVLIGLRYLSLDRVFERDRLAELTNGPLPFTPVEELVRAAFALPTLAPAVVGGPTSMARFAG